MWFPNRPQWTVIWLSFVAALWFFYWGNQRTRMFTRAEHLVVGVFVVIGTALLALVLFSRRRVASAYRPSAAIPGSSSPDTHRPLFPLTRPGSLRTMPR